MKTFNKHPFISISLIVYLVVPLSACQMDGQKGKFPPKEHPESKNWESLFESDLSNAIYSQDIWSFEDGLLTATGDGVIFTRRDYDNFMLDLEFKFGKRANSGVIIYATDHENWIPNSLEVQILDDHAAAKVPSIVSCGSVFGHLAPDKSVVKKPGKWNRMTIACKDQMIYVVLNNQPVLEFNMAKYTSSKVNPDGSEIFSWLSTPKADMPTRGKIGLQGKHGDGDISFRNVKIKPKLSDLRSRQ